MKRLDELDIRPTDHLIASGPGGQVVTWRVADVDAGVLDDMRELRALGWKLYHFRPVPFDPFKPLIAPPTFIAPRITDDYEMRYRVGDTAPDVRPPPSPYAAAVRLLVAIARVCVQAATTKLLELDAAPLHTAEDLPPEPRPIELD